jgi:pyrimidine-nucleoside phosphorylase
MIASGDRLQPVGDSPRVDKHSTGGLGDKVSLILAPLLACGDLHVPMISGRGLGITGGTLDKLEAIPGFRTNLSETEIEQQLRRCGCVITGASERLVPADKKLYALRDVTATVPSIPLITASILSKKAAESLSALILDVKFGSGAFMQQESDARLLMNSLVNTGRAMGISTSALLTDMTQPLGRMVGNANEVMESLAILRNEGPEDARELTIELSARLLHQVKRCPDLASARKQCESWLASGHAYERWEQMVHCQNGRLAELPSLARASDFLAPKSGYLHFIDGQRLGHAVITLGGGRKFVGQAIDPTVGLEMLVRLGDFIEPGQPIVKIYSSNDSKLAEIDSWLATAFHLGDSQPQLVPLFQAGD